MLSDKFLFLLSSVDENNCIEMWYIAIIICVQPQFAEMKWAQSEAVASAVTAIEQTTMPAGWVCWGD